ncbi:MAG: hypothetical protein JO316_13790 [Abitibacteriaceae bacterium]|nr:hypothetical protein [Abditibacteriaceae bacterium]MBV9866420.1 hypothetical protein [Abditibacteriaceae bacterium]
MQVKHGCYKALWGLILIGLVSLSSFYGAHLKAQSEDAGAATSEEAAKEFIGFLTLPYAEPRPNWSPRGVATKKNQDLLGGEGIDRLLQEMYKEFRLSQWKAESKLDAKGDTATVRFLPANEIQPVICAHEENGWHVDLIATYARWNNLDEKEGLQKLSTLTGVVIPGVPANQAVINKMCQSNLKQLGLAIAQYNQDYDELMPPANKWSDVLQPYVKSEAVNHCPAAGQKDYGYAMNWKFSRRSMNYIESLATTTEFYESNVLQRNRNGDGKDLTFRHEVEGVLGANYTYADGHVKWNRFDQPQEFRLAPPGSTSRPTIPKTNSTRSKPDRK